MEKVRLLAFWNLGRFLNYGRISALLLGLGKRVFGLAAFRILLSGFPFSYLHNSSS